MFTESRRPEASSLSALPWLQSLLKALHENSNFFHVIFPLKFILFESFMYLYNESSPGSCLPSKSPPTSMSSCVCFLA